MCGIIGFISQGDVDITKYRDRLLHRGPDGEGVFKDVSGEVVFAHRRLTILDNSPSGRQPMESQCGRYVLVFNGELYNYIEIRRLLEDRGRTFRGTGDTEVVLTAYAEWGEDCLKYFNGMFALGVFDKGNACTPPSIFIARDRAGKKPLFYAHRGECLVFSSELKAIPSQMRGQLDLSALNFYLALGYIPGELCITSGVAKLPAGHAGRFSLASKKLDIWQWWALPPLTARESGADVGALLEEAEALVRDAVALRMRSDVPVGVLLSGGLDSSLVAACAAQTQSRPIKTFTMGLPGSKLDETRHAAIVSKHFSTEHRVIESTGCWVSALEDYAPFIDEPLADSSIIPAYLVSKFTAGHVKVALGGDGGDELFGGYGDYTTAFKDKTNWGWLPTSMFNIAASIAARLPAGVPGRNRINALRGGPFQSLVWGSPFFDAALRRKIFTRDVLAQLGNNFLAPERYRQALFNSGVDPVDSMTRTHFGSILPDDFLTKVDRTSMAASLEVRSPLLDFRLIEFAFSRLPSAWKVNETGGRRLQKLLGKRLLPPALDLDRKQGFSVPMDDWIRTGKIEHYTRLTDIPKNIIRESYVNNLIAGQARGRTNGARLFALIMLSISLKNLSKW